MAARAECRFVIKHDVKIIVHPRPKWKQSAIALRRKVPLTRWARGVAFEDPNFGQHFERLLEEKTKRLQTGGKVLRSRSPLVHLDLFRASDDIAIIDLWMAQWPTAGFAVACGPSSLLVLDIDRHGQVDGMDTVLRLLDRYGKLPTSPLQHTGGGGFQIFFAMPTKTPLRNSCGKLGAGLDTRGKGGMTVIPPSIHPSGKVYRWKAGREPWAIPLAMPPTWLVDLLCPRAEPSHPRAFHEPLSKASLTNYAAHALTAELERLRQAKQGERNNVLNRVSFVLGQLAAIGLLAEDATLRLIAGTALMTGLPEPEITRTMRSGWERGLAQPREIR